MYLSPGGFQLASSVGSTQPDSTARGCGLTSGSDADRKERIARVQQSIAKLSALTKPDDNK